MRSNSASRGELGPASRDESTGRLRRALDHFVFNELGF